MKCYEHPRIGVDSLDHLSSAQVKLYPRPKVFFGSSKQLIVISVTVPSIKHFLRVWNVTS